MEGVETIIATGERSCRSTVTPLLGSPSCSAPSATAFPPKSPYRMHLRPGWRHGRNDWDRVSSRVSAHMVGFAALPKCSLRSTRCRRAPASRYRDPRAPEDLPPEQRARSATYPLVIDHGDELRDYADTAALISLLDLVVTIDTSVAHLAGALGKPVWMCRRTTPRRWRRIATTAPGIRPRVCSVNTGAATGMTS